MPSTYTTNLGIELPADGELDGVWGDVVNENMDILDRAINGSVALTLSGTTSTLTTSDGALSDGQYKLLVLGGTPSGTHTITIAPNDAQKIYFVRNTTAQSVVFTQGSGGNVTIATGDSAVIYSDGAGAGAAVVNITNDFAMSSVKITGGTIDGTVIGGSSAAAGTFTTAAATTGNITTVNATTVDTTNIEVTTLKAKDGTAAGSIADSTGVVTLASSVLTTTDINGGTIDGTTIGGASAAAGTFTTATATTGNITTVNATTVDTTNIEVTTIKAKDGTSAGSIADSTGVVTLASSVLTTTDINGGTVDGAVIGGSSAAAITGTTITATGDVTIPDKIIHAGDTNTAIRFPAADTVTVETAGAERLRVDSSGNVGIGRTPVQVLDIQTSGVAVARIRPASGSGAGWYVANPGADTTFMAFSDKALTTGGAAGSIASVFTGSSIPLIFEVSASEKMRIDTSGNVGIGQSSASYRLDVSGGIRAKIDSGGDGTGVLLTNDGSANGRIEFLTSDSTGRYRMDGIGDTRFAISTVSGGVWAEAISIDRVTRNVGIGTTSPADGRLNVQAGTSATGNSAFFNNLDGTYNPYLQIQHSSAGVKLFNSSSFGGASNNLIFGNGSTIETMRITNAGELLVGTTITFEGSRVTVAQTQNASTRLSVRNDSTGSSAGAGIALNGSGNSWQIECGSSAKNSNALTFSLDVTAPSEKMRIDTSGNLLVGTTTSPSGSGQIVANGGVYLGGTGSANLLDDYEEGTWTPQVQGASTAGTYTVSISTARYVKIGNQVTLWAYFGFSAASGGTGYAQFRNIPFAYDTGLGIAGTVYTTNFDFSTANPATVAISGSFGASNTVMNLIEVRDAAGGIDAPISGISTTTFIGFTVTYTAA